MDEEQAAFEELTLNDFNKWSSTALKTFNNHNIIITNNSDKKYYECGVFASVAYFYINSAGCSGEFCVVFKHFQNLENLILNILKKKLHISCLVGSFSLRPCKAFRIAQCKQPRLVKPCLNCGLHFIFKTSGTALLETIGSYKPPHSRPGNIGGRCHPQRENWEHVFLFAIPLLLMKQWCK